MSANSVTLRGTNLDYWKKHSQFVEALAEIKGAEDSLKVERKDAEGLTPKQWALFQKMATKLPEFQGLRPYVKNKPENLARGYSENDFTQMLAFFGFRSPSHVKSMSRGRSYTYRANENEENWPVAKAPLKRFWRAPQGQLGYTRVGEYGPENAMLSVAQLYPQRNLGEANLGQPMFLREIYGRLFGARRSRTQRARNRRLAATMYRQGVNFDPYEPIPRVNLAHLEDLRAAAKERREARENLRELPAAAKPAVNLVRAQKEATRRREAWGETERRPGTTLFEKALRKFRNTRRLRKRGKRHPVEKN